MSMIYGEKIRLRAVERADLELFHIWVNDPEVTRNLTIRVPISMVDEENWFEAIASRNQNEKPLAIDIRDGEGWKMIGNCVVFSIEPLNSMAELGIVIGDKNEWNKGYGTETMALLARHCFETLNLNRAYLHVYAENMRAIRAYEKAGFSREGCLRQAVYKHGAYDDVIVMSMLRSEWTIKKHKENK